MKRIPVHTVQAGDVSLAYHESGSGDPVVFIGGLASTMDQWNPPVLEKFSRQFRVILFDNRGTGYSNESGEPFSIALFARDTANLMDALGITRAHIIGHSMGACIAQEFALEFPKRVNRLVLVAGDCGGSEAVKMQPEIRDRLTDKSGTVQDMIRRMFSLLFPQQWLDTHDPFAYCPEVYENTSDEIVARQIETFFAWPGSYSRLGEIQSPTLVLTGDRDVIVPPKNAELLGSRIPDAQLVVFPDGGHGLMYQFPDRFCDTVLGFLD
ncbi:MAG: alpha/beta hydrolase [Methanoregula sp.]